MSCAGSVIETRRSRPSSVSACAISFSNPWCEGRDSNPHASRRQLLRLVRLPIPPPSPLSWSPKSGKKTTYYTLAALFELRAAFWIVRPMSVGHYENFPVASLLLPRRLAAGRDHLPLCTQRRR